MTKPQQDQAAVIRLLEQHGWVMDGASRIEVVRVPTTASPVFGGIGGEARTFGGRPRFHKAGTDLWATVGPKTTCFYSKREVDGREPDVAFLATIPTADITAAADFLATCERPW